jgi:hypothetical protein
MSAAEGVLVIGKAALESVEAIEESVGLVARGVESTSDTVFVPPPSRAATVFVSSLSISEIAWRSASPLSSIDLRNRSNSLQSCPLVSHPHQ